MPAAMDPRRVAELLGGAPAWQSGGGAAGAAATVRATRAAAARSAGGLRLMERP
jgi:hypothetical protein